MKTHRLPLCAALAGLACLLAPLPARAEYWGTESENQAPDMAVQDVKLPYLAETTYNAFWHSWLKSKRGKQTVFFYAGAVHNDHDNPDLHAKTFYQWSFWPCLPDRNPVAPVWCLPGFGMTNEVGEGASARTAGTYVIKPDRWCRHVMRFWSPSNPQEAAAFSYGGWWMKDLEGDGRWRLLAVMRIPLPEARFAGPGLGGFIEDFGHGGRNRRAQGYRTLYNHQEGHWAPCTFYSAPRRDEYQKITPSADQASLLFDIGAKPAEGAQIQAKRVTVTLKQPPAPPIDGFGPGTASATLCGPSLTVAWAMPDTDTPPLRSKIEVLGADAAAPLFTAQVDLPQEREAFLQLTPEQAKRAATVRITTTSLFDQQAVRTVAIKPVDPASGAAPVAVADPKPGVVVRYYTLNGAQEKIPAEKNHANWQALPDAAALTLTRTAFPSQPTLDVMPRKFGVVAKATGHVNIPRDGLYRFHFTACQGGRMSLDGKPLISQDIHGSVNSTAASATLRAGFHLVEMAVYADAAGNPNAPRIGLEMEGPGMARKPVPESAWALPGAEAPADAVAFTATAGGGQAGNRVTFKLGAVAAGAQGAGKIAVINQDGETWATFDAGPAAEKTVILPAGTHRFFPRLYRPDQVVVDLKPVEVSVQNPPLAGWEMAAPDPTARRPFGAEASADRVMLMGDGVRWATQKVRGDFTLTLRVKELTNAVGGPLHTAGASFGFFASADAKRPPTKTFHWTYSPYYRGRYETPAKSFNGLTNQHWVASGHQFPLPGWFRFSRQGDAFKAEISPGAEGPWRTLFEEKAALPETLLIGPYLQQSPGADPGMFYRAEFDGIKVVGGDAAR